MCFVSFQGILPSAERTASVVADLPGLYELTIGWYDAPLTDQFTAQVLISITKSKIKILQVSSSPVLLQEALLTSNKMESLHTLYLFHNTRQVSACSYAKRDGFHLFSLPHYIVSSNSQCNSYICPTICSLFMAISLLADLLTL